VSARGPAEALKEGPSLPQAYVDRGTAHLAWGDSAGALTDAEHAITPTLGSFGAMAMRARTNGEWHSLESGEKKWRTM